MSIKHALLALLLDEPRSASQLQSQFAETTAGVWPLNIGQVSQTLTRLHRDGHIEAAGTTTGPSGHSADTYRLTPTGTQLVTDWFSTPVVQPVAERDELVTKVALAQTRPDLDLIHLLDTQRASIMEDLRALNRRTRNLPDTRTTDRLLVEKRIFELEAQARWLDRVEALHTPESENGHE